MDKFDLKNPLNADLRRRFEEKLIRELKTPSLWTQEKTEYIRTEYGNPGVRKFWEEFLMKERP